MTPGLPHSTPEEQGVPSAALHALVRRWEERGLEPHSVTVLRHGHVVAEGWWRPYHRDVLQLVYSVSKTFTSCAVGFAVAEGLLRLEDRLVDLFPEAAHVAGPRAAELTLHDVLAMRTGHREDTLVWRTRGLASFPETFLGVEPEEDRGWFVYHNGATLMAALAVQQASGQRLLDYLRPRLLDPLGVTDASWQGADGLDAGFSGLHVPTGALAALGELVRRDGVGSDDARVLPDGWVARMTTRHTDTTTAEGTADWRQGYCYQMWRCRHDAVRADGAYGQFAVVVPDAGLVVALTSCTDRTQETLDAIWEELLPALATAPISPDPAAHGALERHLAGAALAAPTGTATPATEGPWTGRHEPSDDVRALQTVEVRRTGDGWCLVLTEGDDAPFEVPCGDGSWPAATGRPFVASGGWTDPDTFEAALVAVETPHVLHLTVRGGVATARWNGVPLNGGTLSRVHAPTR